MTEDKVRENRLRRVAARQGYLLQKSRRRDERAVDYGGYMLVDASSNGIVLGSGAFPYNASLDDVENFLNTPAQTGSDSAPRASRRSKP